MILAMIVFLLLQCLISIIGDSRNKFKSGISATYDDYNELVNRDVYQRSENSFGAFFEYSYDNLGDLNLTVGLRIDTSNLLGTFLTPRLHARYAPLGRFGL